MRDYDEDKSRYLRARYNRPIQEWVDPLKDISARGEKLRLRLTTELDEAEDLGRDIEEIYQTIKYQQDLREKYGIKDAALSAPIEEDEAYNTEIGGKDAK